MPLTFFQSKWYALPFYKKKKKIGQSNPLEFLQEWGNGQGWPPRPCHRALTFPHASRLWWAAGPALKGLRAEDTQQRRVTVRGLTPGWGAGRADCPSPMAPVCGSAPGLCVYEMALGLPSASHAVGCGAGTGLCCPRPQPTGMPPKVAVSWCQAEAGGGADCQFPAPALSAPWLTSQAPGSGFFLWFQKWGGTMITDSPGLLRRLSELLQTKPQGAVSVLGIIPVVSIRVVSIQII